MWLLQMVLIRPFRFSHKTPMYFNTNPNTKESVSLLYRAEANSSSLQRRESLPSLNRGDSFSLTRIDCLSSRWRIEIPPLCRRESVALLYREERHSLLYTEDAASLFSIKRRTPSLCKGEIVSLLCGGERDSSSLQKK